MKSLREELKAKLVVQFGGRVTRWERAAVEDADMQKAQLELLLDTAQKNGRWSGPCNDKSECQWNVCPGTDSS